MRTARALGHGPFVALLYYRKTKRYTSSGYAYIPPPYVPPGGKPGKMSA